MNDRLLLVVSDHLHNHLFRIEAESFNTLQVSVRKTIFHLHHHLTAFSSPSSHSSPLLTLGETNSKKQDSGKERTTWTDVMWMYERHNLLCFKQNVLWCFSKWMIFSEYEYYNKKPLSLSLSLSPSLCFCYIIIIFQMFCWDLLQKQFTVQLLSSCPPIVIILLLLSPSTT